MGNEGEAPERSGSSDNDAGFESFLAALAASPAPYRPPDLQPGDLFADRYCVDRELGRGGMGTVFLVVDRQLERKVALKVARGRRAEVELARLQHEAKIMAGLSHPGIVTVFEAGAHGEDVYLVLEFVPGGTLRDWLDVQPRSWREVVAMFISIAESLAVAHSAGVIHRDFKPHNVLVDQQGEPRIADFGLARTQAGPRTAELEMTSSSNTWSMSGSIVGTPAYMAPEQGAGERGSEASDQFSFFVSLFEAVAGHRPFRGKTLQGVLQSIEDGPPETCPGAPRALYKLVRQGLHAEPGQRHANMLAVARALERVLFARRRKVRNLAIGLGAVAAAGFGFLSAPAAAAPCKSPDLTASIDAAWSDEARQRVETSAGLQTKEQMTRYRDTVAAQRQAACEAHVVAQTLTDTDYALQTACLDRLEGRFMGLRDDLTHGGPPSAAVQVLLPTPASCTELQTLRNLYNAYESTSVRDTAAQDAAAREAERLRMLAALQSRRGDDASEVIEELSALAETHELVDMKAYALLFRSAQELDPAKTNAMLSEAFSLAQKTRDTRLLTELSLQRSVLALRQGQVGPARAYLEQAETVTALGFEEPVSEWKTRHTIIDHEIGLAEGKTQGAVEGLTALLDRLESEDPRTLEVQEVLASALVDEGRLSEAVELYDAALLHPTVRDPQLAFGLQLNRVLTLLSAGDAEAATRGLETTSRLLGPADQLPPGIRGYLEYARTQVALLKSDLDQAAHNVRSADALFREASPDHPVLADIYDLQASLAQRRGDHETARTHALESIRRRDEALGPGTAASGLSHVRLSKALRGLGRNTEAASAARAAIAMIAEGDRPAGELAIAKLALASALGLKDAGAAKTCEDSELALCRGAL